MDGFYLVGDLAQEVSVTNGATQYSFHNDGCDDNCDDDGEDDD